MAIIYANVKTCEDCPLSKAQYHYGSGGYTSCEILCGFSDDRFVGYDFPPNGAPLVPDWCPLRAEVSPEIYEALKDVDIVGFNCM